MKDHLATIDIIVAIYNCEKYIDRCISSLLKQKCQNQLRIILVDDGSTDNSKNIIDKYANKYGNVIAVHKENGGVSSARNAGLELVQSTYFSFVDPDDWVSDNYFDLVIKELQKSKADILMTPYIRKYKNIELKNLLFGERNILFSKEQTKMVLRRLFGLVGSELQRPLTIDNLSTTWAKFYRSNKFSKIKFVDREIIYSEDLWFNILCFLKAGVTEYYTDAFYIYYKNNDGSLVNTYDPKILHEYMTLYSYMKKVIDNYELPESFNKALSNRIILNELTVLRNANRSKASYLTKIKYINNILNNPRYRSEYQKFNFSFLPKQYVLFYKACKYRLTILVMLMLYFGERLKTRKE